MNQRSRKAKIKVLPDKEHGLPILKIEPFLKKTQQALQVSLGLNIVSHVKKEVGRNHTYYFRTPVPIELNREQEKIIALPLHQGKYETAWIVVEIKCEIIDEIMLTHSSLKLYSGPTSDAAKLYFRAEWDPRANLLDHAQPHWNIHDEAIYDAEAPIDNFQLFKMQNDQLQSSFADMIANEDSHFNQNKIPKNSLKIKKFHFAMSAYWHKDMKLHTHSLDNEEALMSWIKGCVTYIKKQIEFLDS